MKELILIILVLDVIAEIFYIRRLTKERDSAEERATTHFKRANNFEKQLKETKNNFNHKPSSYEGGLFKRFFFDSWSKLWFSIIHCRVIIKVF